MSIITAKTFSDGDTPTATDLNKPYSDLAAATIDDNNTSKRWAIREHFKTSPIEPINEMFGSSITAGSMSTSSTTWTDVVLGSVPVSATVNKTNAALMRLEWDCLIGGDFEVPAQAGAQQQSYKFRIKVSLNSGGTIYYAAHGQYGFVAKADTTSTLGDIAVIYWRTCAGTDLLSINKNDTVDSITLQVIVGDALNTLVIERASCTAILIRN
jgi:hypothetical protein